MTSDRQLRGSGRSPSPVLGLLIGALFFFGACATTPTRPPVPIGSGDPRVDPVPGSDNNGGKPDDGGDTGTPDTGGADSDPGTVDTDNDGGYTPGFMADRDLKRVAVLLPFSHPNSRARGEAEGMLAAIEMALFDHAGEDFLILPKDTGGRRSQAESVAKTALDEKADMILGPLFAANVKAVRGKVARKGVPVVSFSNDLSAAGYGAYLASITPEAEVVRVMDYAAAQGVRSYAFLGPDTAYGRRVETAMRRHVSRIGGVMISSAFYDKNNDSPVNEAKQIASAIKADPGARSGRIAVMVPEGGTKLRQVAPLLPYNGVDLRYVKLLGTGLWDDPAVWREPTLVGGLFAAPDPERLTRFREAYKRLYGRNPSDLATLAYDAAAMAILLANDDQMTNGGVTDPDGFMGVNGLFRFRLNGTAERGLAVMQIQEQVGAVVIEKGASEFVTGSS